MHTKKIFAETLRREYGGYKIIINIYHSGRGTWSAWLRVVDLAGSKIKRREVKTRSRSTAKREIYTWARDYLDQRSEAESSTFITTERLEKALKATGALETLIGDLETFYLQGETGKAENFGDMVKPLNELGIMLEEEIQSR